MPKTAKHLEVQARYIYNPEFRMSRFCLVISMRRVDTGARLYTRMYLCA